MEAVAKTNGMTAEDRTNYYRKLAETHAPAITKQIAEFEQSSIQPIQGFGKQLRTLILEKDLGYTVENMHHSHVAGWEENRQGEMVLPARMLTLLNKCVAKGWSDDETLLALAREVSSSMFPFV